MSENNLSERNLIFFAGPIIGLGHFLTSVSIYKHYAFEHGRTFHIVCKNWNMAIDRTLDVDPLFSFMDQEAISQVNVSYRSVMSLLEASKQQQRTTLVTADRDVLNSNSAEQFIFMHESLDLPGQNIAEWMESRTFRKNHLNASNDHHADNILIFNAPAVHDRSKDYKPYDQYNGFAPFSGNFGAADAVVLDESIGLHIRHGNGEHLHNRVEGGSR
ncbi:MAG: hypothetical protein HRT90_08280, partial [Candidatus Margulisbacteria bacterium]|nr:hypothetical protein [Candidatus Margulisiibacteriota bacterium]